MTVRAKIFSILLVSTGLLLASVFILTRLILAPRVDLQDETRVRDNVARVRQAVEDDLIALDRTTNDYSAWDDSYAFIQKPNEAFLKANLVASTFSINHVRFIVFLDSQGEIVAQKGYDAAAGRETPLPAGLAERLKPGSRLLRQARDSSIKGFLSLSGEICLVSAQPILTSENEGPARGTLVAGRRVDEDLLRSFSKSVRLTLAFRRFDAEEAGREFAGVDRNQMDFVSLRDDGTAEGTALFRDLDGRPTFLLSFKQDRLLRRQYKNGERIFLFALMVYGVLGMFISLLFTDRFVTSRVTRLSRFIKEVGATGDLNRRVRIRGRDEVSHLAEETNSMLTTTRGQMAKAEKAEVESKQNEVKYRTLFEASTDAVFLETLAGRILDCNQTASEMLGYSKDELRTMTATELLPPDLLSLVSTVSQTLAEQGRVQFETINLAKNGEAVPVEINVRLARIGAEDFAVTIVHDLRARRKDERLRASVFEISQAASSAGELQELYILIHKTVTALLPVPNFYIALLDDSGERITFPYFIDEIDQRPEDRPIGRGLTGYVLRQGEPLLVTADQIRDLERAGVLAVQGTHPACWLGVPLKDENRTIGIMTIQTYQEGKAFGEAEKGMLMFMSSQVAMAIQRVRSRERIQASLREKELLLREVHHRVKNNMQIISSLFNLQAGEIKDAAAIELLRECQARIRSMSLVHEKLYQSKDLARINFSEYIQSLAVHLFHFWRVDPNRIRLQTELEAVDLDINTAIPCGLMINEMLSNALEHAFPSGRAGFIAVRLKKTTMDFYELVVQDNGVGIPPDLDPARSGTLGLQLIDLLAKQLDGKLTLIRDGGTRFAVSFHEQKFKPRL